MKTTRRTILKGVGGALALPLLESISNAAPPNSKPPKRFLVVGNPFGAHPDHFFPKDFGNDFSISPTLKSLEWLKDRMTIVSRFENRIKAD